MKRFMAFYGDDFTGSTDVMEALASHGIETVLFTRIPRDDEFGAFANHDAIGLAGSSRSQSPTWMDQNLPAVFNWLKSLEARYCHYKVCSTFDSAPHVGSIGRAIDIGAECFGQPVIPLLVGAPQLKRYTFAGHLFAGYRGEVYRIDRHPVMGRHPVTPMHESDLRLHLAYQTQRKIALLGEDWPSEGVALLDVHDESSQKRAGERLLSLPATASPFVVGSSGLEYAMIVALAAQRHSSGNATFAPLQPMKQIIVVSGSVSPTTERQVRTALNQGFVGVAVDAMALAVGDDGAVNAVCDSALRILNDGYSPLIHTALGPGSDAGAKLNVIPAGRERIGVGLGQILRRLSETSDLRRAIIAGGDSSSHALSQLDIFALTCRLPLAETPGSPLCLAHSNKKHFQGLEIALKGGQVGQDDYFVWLRDGKR